MILIAIFAPVIAPYDPSSSEFVKIGDVYNPPSSEHWFGTDDAGQDVFSNFVFGARVSIVVGFFAAFISIVLGGALGLSAGFYGGRTDNIIMRFTDIMLVIPDLALIVVIIALTKPSLLNIIFVIGLLGWTTTARVVRSQTLAVKSRKFVLRARAIGAGNTAHHRTPHSATSPANPRCTGCSCCFERSAYRKHTRFSWTWRPIGTFMGPNAELRV